MEPLPGEVGSPTDYTFEQTALQGGFFVSGEQVTLDPDAGSTRSRDLLFRNETFASSINRNEGRDDIMAADI